MEESQPGDENEAQPSSTAVSVVNVARCVLEKATIICGLYLKQHLTCLKK